MSGRGKNKKRRNQAETAPQPSSTNARHLWGAPAHEWVLGAGLGLLVYWRPWQDGFVAPHSNAWFLTGILILLVVWAGRVFTRAMLDVPVVAIVLLTAFLGAALLSGLSSVQYHTTQIAFTVWCGHAMIFVLAASLRSGVAMGFVLACFVVTSTAEGLWAIIHVKYSMPETRTFVMNNPASASALFNTELNAELVNRLNSNRAFGSLLFANALASWLVASIPISLFGARYAFQKYRAGDELLNPVQPIARGFMAGAAVAMLSTAVLMFAPGVSAFMQTAYPNSVMRVPFSQLLVSIPSSMLGVILVQLLVLAAALGIFVALRMLIKPSSQPGEETAAHALIAGVVTAAVVCVAIAVLYSRFHLFYFAEAVTLDGAVQYIRAPLHEPFVLFAINIVVIPIAAAAVAIRVTRKKGLATFAWLAAAVVFAIAAVSQGAALWMTYSRGGMLALAAGMAVTLFLIRPRKAAPESAPVLNAAAAGLILVAMAVSAGLHGNAFAQNPAAEPPANPYVQDIDVEGDDMTVADIVNPATVSLRFTYWAAAFKMASDYALRGVGLGNFGVIYPQYQSLTASESATKQAHNDFLQIFCDTGVIGFAFFTAFWVWFAIAGGRRLRAESSRDCAWCLAALYAATMGFLAHAVVDFPFQDPSLAMLAFLLAGMFWAQAQAATDKTTQNAPVARIAAAGSLVVAAIVVNTGLKLGYADAAIGNDLVRHDRFRNATQILNWTTMPNGAPHSAPDSALALVVEDAETRKAFGKYFYQPNPGQGDWAMLPPGSPIPPGSMLMVTNMPLAQAKVREASVGWTTKFAEIDAVYPHDPGLALHISLWFDMLWRTSGPPEAGLEYIKQAGVWAEEAVRRSPGQVAFHDWLFRMRWRRGLSEPETADQLAYYEQSLEALDRTIELYPIKPDLWDKHARIYHLAAKRFAERGEPERAEEYEAIAIQSEQEAADLRERLAALRTERES